MKPRERRDPRELLPLGAPIYRILVALGAGPRHGYAIMKELEERTAGRDAILPGTLYTSIARMLEDGLIEELPSPPAESGDGRRRYYRLTAFGRAVGRAESERLARLLELAREGDLAEATADDAS